MESDASPTKEDANCEDKAYKLEKLKESFLILKQKMCRSHDLIQQYNDKLKECERLKSDLCAANKEAKKMTSNYNVTLAKVIKLELQNAEYKKNIDVLSEKISDHDAKMAGERQNVQQLICKIKEIEEKHSERLVEHSVEKSSLEIRVKELEQELKATKKSQKVTVKKTKQKGRSTEEDNPESRQDIKVKTRVDIGVNTIDNINERSIKLQTAEASTSTMKPLLAEKSTSTVKPHIAEKYTSTDKLQITEKSTLMNKPQVAEKSVLTDDFYSIKNDPYPLFCNECEVRLDRWPTERTTQKISDCPKFMEDIVTPPKILPGIRSGIPGIPNAINTSTPSRIQETRIESQCTDLLLTNAMTQNNSASMTTNTRVIEKLKKKISKLERKVKERLPAKAHIENNCCQHHCSHSNQSLTANPFAIPPYMQMSPMLWKNFMDMCNEKEQKNRNVDRNLRKFSSKKIKLKRLSKEKSNPDDSWCVESMPQRNKYGNHKKQQAEMECAKKRPRRKYVVSHNDDDDDNEDDNDDNDPSSRVEFNNETRDSDNDDDCNPSTSKRFCDRSPPDEMEHFSNSDDVTSNSPDNFSNLHIPNTMLEQLECIDEIIVDERNEKNSEELVFDSQNEKDVEASSRLMDCTDFPHMSEKSVVNKDSANESVRMETEKDDELSEIAKEVSGNVEEKSGNLENIPVNIEKNLVNVDRISENVEKDSTKVEINSASVDENLINVDKNSVNAMDTLAEIQKMVVETQNTDLSDIDLTNQNDLSTKERNSTNVENDSTNVDKENISNEALDFAAVQCDAESNCIKKKSDCNIDIEAQERDELMKTIFGGLDESFEMPNIDNQNDSDIPESLFNTSSCDTILSASTIDSTNDVNDTMEPIPNPPIQSPENSTESENILETDIYSKAITPMSPDETKNNASDFESVECKNDESMIYNGASKTNLENNQKIDEDTSKMNLEDVPKIHHPVGSSKTPKATKRKYSDNQISVKTNTSSRIRNITNVTSSSSENKIKENQENLDTDVVQYMPTRKTRRIAHVPKTHSPNNTDQNENKEKQSTTEIDLKQISNNTEKITETNSMLENVEEKREKSPPPNTHKILMLSRQLEVLTSSKRQLVKPKTNPVCKKKVDDTTVTDVSCETSGSNNNLTINPVVITESEKNLPDNKNKILQSKSQISQTPKTSSEMSITKTDSDRLQKNVKDESKLWKKQTNLMESALDTSLRSPEKESVPVPVTQLNTQTFTPDDVAPTFSPMDRFSRENNGTNRVSLPQILSQDISQKDRDDASTSAANNISLNEIDTTYGTTFTEFESPASPDEPNVSSFDDRCEDTHLIIDEIPVEPKQTEKSANVKLTSWDKQFNDVKDRIDARKSPVAAVKCYLQEIATEKPKITKRQMKKKAHKNMCNLTQRIDASVKKQFQKLINSEWELEIHQEIVNRLSRSCSPRIIAKCLIEFIAEITSCKTGVRKYLDSTFTPPAPLMTRPEQKLTALLLDLNEIQPTLIELVQRGIEYKLFRLNNAPQRERISELTRLYTVLARIKKDREQVRILCCSAIYCLGLNAVPLLYTVLTCWPEVFPRERLEQDILLKCLSHLIVEQQASMEFPKLVPLKKLMTIYYKYPSGKYTAQSILKELLTCLQESDYNGLNTAIILLAKREGTAWAYKNIVQAELLPMIINNKHPCIYKAFCLLGHIMRTFPIKSEDNTVKKLIEQLCDLMDSGEGSVDQQEGVASALLSLSRHDFKKVMPTVMKWVPQKPLRPTTYEQLQAVFKAYTPEYWKTYIK